MEEVELEEFATDDILFSRRFTSDAVMVGEKNCLSEETLSTSLLLSINNKYGYVTTVTGEGKKKKFEFLIL